MADILGFGFLVFDMKAAWCWLPQGCARMEGAARCQAPTGSAHPRAGRVCQTMSVAGTGLVRRWQKALGVSDGFRGWALRTIRGMGSAPVDTIFLGFCLILPPGCLPSPSPRGGPQPEAPPPLTAFTYWDGRKPAALRTQRQQPDHEPGGQHCARSVSVSQKPPWDPARL